MLWYNTLFMIRDDAPSNAQEWFDFTAICLAGLCVVHCFGAALLVGLLSSTLVGDFWHHEGVHLALLLIAAPLTLWTLVRGFAQHGNRWSLIIGIAGLKLMALALFFTADAALESWITLSGVLLVALGHIINLRLHSRRSRA